MSIPTLDDQIRTRTTPASAPVRLTSASFEVGGEISSPTREKLLQDLSNGSQPALKRPEPPLTCAALHNAIYQGLAC